MTPKPSTSEGKRSSMAVSRTRSRKLQHVDSRTQGDSQVQLFRECAGQMKAMDKCQSQTRSDPALKKVREDVKANVTKCYERFPNTRKTGGNRPSFPSGGAAGGFGGPRPGPPPPFGVGPPPPPGPGFGPADPCAPTGDEILCLKQAMDTDQTISAHGNRLREQERQCFTK